MALTVEQRAQRRTRKINNRTAKRLPLFAGTLAISQFLTDVATQTKAVQRWDEINERFFAQLEAGDQQTIAKAQALRSQVAELQPGKLLEYDAELEHLVARHSAYRNNPAYIADFWHTRLQLTKGN